MACVRNRKLIKSGDVLWVLACARMTVLRVSVQAGYLPANSFK
jgi:hypothetical protein